MVRPTLHNLFLRNALGLGRDAQASTRDACAPRKRAHAPTRSNYTPERLSAGILLSVRAKQPHVWANFEVP